MKAPRFAYARPASLAEALALLAEYKDDARVLAGGQSLVPMMNFRVAAPKVLVDINRIAGLSGIKVAKNHVRIGALTRHVELERSADVAKHLPLVASAMPHIAHPAIRNRGTFGGSCALADPAAELPACALALAATFVAAGKKGERRISAPETGLRLGVRRARAPPWGLRHGRSGRARIDAGKEIFGHARGVLRRRRPAAARGAIRRRARRPARGGE